MGEGEAADPAAVSAARELGRLIAGQGWVVLSGGRDAGVMQAVNAGAKEIPGSLTVGILPTAQARPSPDVDIVIVTDLHEARNNINVLSSDVVVACGRAGAGTISEIALALKNGKTVLLLASDRAAIDLFQPIGKARIIVVQTPTEAIETIQHLRRSKSNAIRL